MYTVNQLAKRVGISRTTLLYYEREGLIAPALRAENGYRYYSDAELAKLERILSYRSLGVPIVEIKELIQHDSGSSNQALLRRQFESLEIEIQKLRSQQQAIVTMLQEPDLLQHEQLDKQRWTALLRASGMSDEDMLHWHAQFERLEPLGHEAFLVSLGIEAQERTTIREQAREALAKG